MSYCPNCGAERGYYAKICEFCGYSFDVIDDLEDKDIKINQLEHKLHQLENSGNIKSTTADNSQFKYFWIIAGLMIIGFFSFIFFFVYMASN